MLIIAALNLPYTTVFSRPGDDDLQVQDTQHPTEQTKQSLVHAEPETPAVTKPEVPFDFEAEPEEEPLQKPPLSMKGKISRPQKSIVDERVPVEQLGKSNLRRRSTELSPPLPELGLRSKSNPTGSPHQRAIEILEGQKHQKSLLAILKGTSHLDDDVIYERERLAGSDSLKRTPSAASISSSGSFSAYNRRRKGSVASLTSRDEAAALLDGREYHLGAYRAANRGLFNALEGARAMNLIPATKCVGMIGTSSDLLSEQLKWEISDRMMQERSCYPVFVPDAEREGHYQQYCKEFLWPTFHCQIPDIPSSKAYEEHSWGDYVKVNEAIATKIIEIYEEGDTVWVHDYHLMLVPLMVRKRLPHASIGFFMHVAFPSSEVFRCLAYRADLLSGLLAANLVGFHIQEFAQHFKMSLARILAVDITGPNIIETEDHDIFVTSSPIGIDPARLDRIMDRENLDSAVQQHRRVIRSRWPHQRIIAARDKTDPIRGLHHKLRAFDKFLSENPHWASKTVLVQICTSSNTESTTESGLESLAEQINSKYGDIASGVQPVVLLKQDVKFEQYLALLVEANGFCVSCLRDGMNLTCHEYVYCNDSSRQGPLILSEFTGSAKVFGEEALLINPWNVDQMAQAFKACVEMSAWEKEHRWKSLKAKVVNHQSWQWADTLTKRIEQAWQDEMSRETNKPDVTELQRIYELAGPEDHRLFILEVERPLTDEARKVIETKGGTVPKSKYESSNVTLSNPLQPGDVSKIQTYYSTRLDYVIRDLCSDPRNIVYIMSAESPDHMERIYRSLPGLGLIAEFGKFVRIRDADQWTEIGSPENTEWQEKLQPLLRALQERSLVSKISVHESSIAIEFNSQAETDEQRDLSTIGEYMSLIRDQHSLEHGVRTKLENDKLTVYTDNLGEIRKHAYEYILKNVHTEQLSMLMLANQPYAMDADDVIYAWAEKAKEKGRTRELVTAVIGKHPSHARYMVEGTNALLSFLQRMKNSH